LNKIVIREKPANLKKIDTLKQINISFEDGEIFDATEEDIVNAIVKLGFKKSSRRTKTGDYVFENPENSTFYTSTTNGYVRYTDPTATYWRTGEPITTKTPISKYIFPDAKDRLLIILRLIMKKQGLWKTWKNKKLSAGEFFHQYRGLVTSRNFDI
jgi:hypothetical protein